MLEMSCAFLYNVSKLGKRGKGGGRGGMEVLCRVLGVEDRAWGNERTKAESDSCTNLISKSNGTALIGWDHQDLCAKSTQI